MQMQHKNRPDPSNVFGKQTGIHRFLPQYSIRSMRRNTVPGGPSVCIHHLRLPSAAIYSPFFLCSDLVFSSNLFSSSLEFFLHFHKFCTLSDRFTAKIVRKHSDMHIFLTDIQTILQPDIGSMSCHISLFPYRIQSSVSHNPFVAQRTICKSSFWSHIFFMRSHICITKVRIPAADIQISFWIKIVFPIYISGRSKLCCPPTIGTDECFLWYSFPFCHPAAPSFPEVLYHLHFRQSAFPVTTVF